MLFNLWQLFFSFIKLLKQYLIHNKEFKVFLYVIQLSLDKNVSKIAMTLYYIDIKALLPIDQMYPYTTFLIQLDKV